MRKIPKHFQEFTKKYTQIASAYENLAAECRKSGPLNEREQTLIKLGVAIGSCREGSVHSQIRKGLDSGLKPDDIRHAVLLATTAIGFPAMMATLSWAEDVLKR
jgi:4-carboxymuconolactone decarboxylase